MAFHLLIILTDRTGKLADQCVQWRMAQDQQGRTQWQAGPFHRGRRWHRCMTRGLWAWYGVSCRCFCLHICVKILSCFYFECMNGISCFGGICGDTLRLLVVRWCRCRGVDAILSRFARRIRCSKIVDQYCFLRPGQSSLVTWLASAAQLTSPSLFSLKI